MSERFFIGKSRRKSSRLTEEGKRFLEAWLVHHVKYIDQGMLFLQALLNKVMRVERNTFWDPVIQKVFDNLTYFTIISTSIYASPKAL